MLDRRRRPRRGGDRCSTASASRSLAPRCPRRAAGPSCVRRRARGAGPGAGCARPRGLRSRPGTPDPPRTRRLVPSLDRIERTPCGFDTDACSFRADGKDVPPRRSSARRRSARRGRRRVARGPRTPRSTCSVDRVRGGQRTSRRRAGGRAGRAGAPLRARNRRSPAGPDRAASPRRRGRGHRLRQAPSAARDLRPLARAAGRAPPHARRRSPCKGGDRAGQGGLRRRARRGRGRRATRWSASASACPARCTGPRASSATPRSCRAGPGRAPRGVAEALELPVEVENDANLGALGEWMWGAGRGAAHMAYVKAATGIGAGFIVANAPYVGAGGTAGELGHTVVDPGGPICRCGNRGCLETYAGAPGDPQLAARRARRRAHAAGRRRAGRPRRRRLPARDRRRRHARSAPRWRTLCNLFNPHRVVVGGDLGAAGELLLTPLRESLVRGAIRSAAEDVTVVQGELGDRAEVLGAVALVLGRGAEATTA